MKPFKRLIISLCLLIGHSQIFTPVLAQEEPARLRQSLEISAGTLLHIPTFSLRYGYLTPWLDNRVSLQARYALLTPNLIVPRPEMALGHGLSLGGRYYLFVPEHFWQPYLQADLAGLLIPNSLTAGGLLFGLGSEFKLAASWRIGISLSSGLASTYGYYAPPITLIPPLLEVSFKSLF